MRLIAPLAVLVMVSCALVVCNNGTTNAGLGSHSTAATASSSASGIAEAQAPPIENRGGADWPQFLGPNANGMSPLKGISKDWSAKPPHLLWKAPLSDKGFAGPSVANGMVFILDHQGSQEVLRAIDLKTGKDVWTYKYEENFPADNGFTRATPTVRGGKVWSIGRKGELNCLNAKTGKPIWSKNIVAEFGGKLPQWDMACSPVIDGRRLIVSPGAPNAAVVALDKDTGAVIWKGGGSDKPGYATPAIATINGANQYVILQANAVVGISVEDGHVIWRHPWNTSFFVNAATPLVIGNSVFVTSGYGRGCGMINVESAGAKLRYQNKNLTSRFNTPVLYNGYIYGIGEPGNMSCVDPKTGEAAWKQPGFEWGGLVLVDGVILALTGNTGDLVMVAPSPEGYRELGRITPLGGKSWTAPIVAQGRLIVRNEKELACFSLK